MWVTQALMQDSLCSNPNQAEQQHFGIPNKVVILGLLTLGMHKWRRKEYWTWDK